EMRTQLAALLEHEHAPLAVAQQAAGLVGDTPLFTSLFNYRHISSAARAAEGDRQPTVQGIRNVYSRVQNSYPLTVSANDLGSGGMSLSVLAVNSVDARGVGLLVRTVVENLVAALTVALDDGPDLALQSVGVLDGR
ncbi:hypothetical protein, partial [Nonomuraea turkmeniaca]|uniref:hypothetical protein n=1 Tax=Nonomuraea turkmeniaca TaxID=103838 RepID=UPI00147746CE